MASNASNSSTGGTGLQVSDLTDKPNATAVDLQFPSDMGKPNVEVAKRSADVDKASSSVHEKVFVLLRREWEKVDQDAIHEANKTAVRQYMASNGLRTDAKVTFVGEESVDEPSLPLNPYDESVGLRYRVAAVPARVASYEAGTMTFPEDATE